MEARLKEISLNEALLCLGHRAGSVPRIVKDAIARACARIRETVVPRAHWRAFPMSGGRLTGCAFQPAGSDMEALLTGCEAAILLGVTLGAEADRMLTMAQATDMAYAAVLDACLSAAVEGAADDFCAQLAQKYAEDGLFLTDRFSPGYGDFPLAQQGELIAALDAQRRMGLTVSPFGLLAPMKSITAVIGVSKEEKPRRARGCAHCNRFENCPYRKENKTCGK